MAQRRHHYEAAFEHFLRANGIPYVAVDEARRALQGQTTSGGRSQQMSLKSFDFVVYADAGPNLLVDVKGRKHAAGNGRQLQNWVTQDDIDCLKRWAGIFGEGFEPAFAFLFWCDDQPPDALFLEVFEFGTRWYSLLGCRLGDYEPHARQRSAKWGTVSIPAARFNEISKPIGHLLSGER